MIVIPEPSVVFEAASDGFFFVLVVLVAAELLEAEEEGAEVMPDSDPEIPVLVMEAELSVDEAPAELLAIDSGALSQPDRIMAQATRSAAGLQDFNILSPFHAAEKARRFVTHNRTGNTRDS